MALDIDFSLFITARISDLKRAGNSARGQWGGAFDAQIEHQERDAAAVETVYTTYRFSNRDKANSAAGLEQAVRILAARWSDHPDYRPEWAPETLPH